VPDGAGRFIASPAPSTTVSPKGEPVRKVVRETVEQLLDAERVKAFGYDETDEQRAHEEALKAVVPLYDGAQKLAAGDLRGGVNSALTEVHDQALREAAFMGMGRGIGKKVPRKPLKPAWGTSNVKFSRGKFEELPEKGPTNGGGQRQQVLPKPGSTPKSPFNPDAPVFVPRSRLNPDAPAFIPRSSFNPDAPAFVPRGRQLTYPSIPPGTAVAPDLLQQIVNLPPSQRRYQIIGQWHDGFEPWAFQHGFNKGSVTHFNVQTPGGPMLHVYWNANGQLEVVPPGGKPRGY
jgi:hypothetical protein